MNHTPEPWNVEFQLTFDLHPRLMAVVDGERLCIASTIGTKTTRDKLSTPQKLANMKRAAECVNGCAGINPAAVGEALAIMERLIKSIDDLIEESDGVAGLHKNGDIAPWSSLVCGGKFEPWLSDLEDAREALAQAKEAQQ